MTFTGELLARVLGAAPRTGGRPTLTNATFERATFADDAEFFAPFTGKVSFDWATFEGMAWFHGSFGGDATFNGAAFVRRAEFQAPFMGNTWFDAAMFHGDAYFTDTTFAGSVRFDGATFHQNVDFHRATFRYRTDFGSSTFRGRARFTRANFQGKTTFYTSVEGDVELPGTPFGRNATIYGATFHGNAEFVQATFHGDVGFNGATFHSTPEFVNAIFHGKARFTGAVFHRDARVDDATFHGDTSFERSRFHGVAFFNGATFRQNASFFRTTFRDLSFAGTIVQREARFNHAVFEQVKRLGPMLVHRTLVLDDAVFQERVQIEVSVAVLCSRRSRFLSGTHIRARWAEIVLDDADLAGTSILSGALSPFSNLEEGRWGRALERLRRRIGVKTPKPRLLSLRRADVAGLTIADVDLRACRFLSAHNLDRLRIEECDLAPVPWFRGVAKTWAAPRTSGWGRPTRLAIAEEHHWRARRYGRAPDVPESTTNDSPGAEPVRFRRRSARNPDRSRTGGPVWYRHAQQQPSWEPAVEPPTAAQVAAIYRDLRKGREDAKDEPGAADFYYGEMEMRRHASSRRVSKQHRESGDAVGKESALPALGEHLILWLYWLTSGYGLRAWRALTALAALVLLAAAVFTFWGFAASDEPAVRPVAVDDDSAPIYEELTPERRAGLDELPSAIRFSAQASTSLLRGTDVPLTAWGEWLHLVLRLVGPILLGLTILSIRGRVRR